MSDRALILMAVRQRLGLAGSGSGLHGSSIQEDRNSGAHLLAAEVDCEDGVAEKGGAAEVQPRKGAEEDLNVRGRGGSEADSSFPGADETHGRERQKGKAAVEKAMAESGDGRSGVGGGVRNQQFFGRCR